MFVWIVSVMHANGRFEPKSAHMSEDEARWTVGSIAGNGGNAVTLARVKLMDYSQAELAGNVARIGRRAKVA